MRLIFHIPLKIDRNDPSASQIRPQKLMKAFADLGLPTWAGRWT